MKHKIMQVMMGRDEHKKLSGVIELDDAYLGGERTGCERGRGTDGKTPLATAVETTEEHFPMRIKLTAVSGFRTNEIKAWSEKHPTGGSMVIFDGLACFYAVVDAGCSHDKIVCGGGRASVEELEFYWVNTILGNLKSVLRSTYHAIRPK